MVPGTNVTNNCEECVFPFRWLLGNLLFWLLEGVMEVFGVRGLIYFAKNPVRLGKNYACACLLRYYDGFNYYSQHLHKISDKTAT